MHIEHGKAWLQCSLEPFITLITQGISCSQNFGKMFFTMLGKFEEAVMLGVIYRENSSYAADLCAFLAASGMDQVKSSAVLSTLKRLEGKMLVSSRPGPEATKWRGQLRMLYSVSHTGRLQLKRSILITGRLVAKATAAGTLDLRN